MRADLSLKNSIILTCSSSLAKHYSKCGRYYNNTKDLYFKEKSELLYRVVIVTRKE